MRTILYPGEIWEGPAVHPELWSLLCQKNVLIELVSGPPPYRVTLGVPHHAAPGVDKIADAWINPRTRRFGRPADETTGLFGLAVFTGLLERSTACKLVIVAHPLTHDPNKMPGAPYWQTVFSEPLPELLLELHGAGKKRWHTLELSAGKNQRADPLRFGQALASRLGGAPELAAQLRAGTSEARLFRPDGPETARLENPALQTLSLTYAGELGIPALHLEMKASLRQPDPRYPGAPRPTQAGWRLARALADVILAG